MKKVLILTAGFGEGHNAAARNLRDALELASDDVKVEVLDLFESSYGAFNTFAKNAYLGMVQYAPRLWGGIYSLLDNSTFLENGVAGFGQPEKRARRHPPRNAAGLRRLHLSRLRARHPGTVPRPFRAPVPVHHRS